MVVAEGGGTEPCRETHGNIWIDLVGFLEISVVFLGIRTADGHIQKNSESPSKVDWVDFVSFLGSLRDSV